MGLLFCHKIAYVKRSASPPEKYPYLHAYTTIFIFFVQHASLAPPGNYLGENRVCELLVQFLADEQCSGVD